MQHADRLKAIGERLRRAYHAEKVILYGSCASGRATEDSDIDLLVIAPSSERFFDRMATVLRLIRDLRRGLPVSPIVLSPEELAERQKRNDPFIREILDTGVAL
ncbi:MAG: nucleotidyltransferase domain-containing protein [Planctomycetes bacterium]|nr:nucleotidyltransferase domain-containing protein [Planctomycetota bacterium]MBM4087560.1 nucleotidyltransferase domain-containing protein [Planctomycetota bacterium]